MEILIWFLIFAVFALQYQITKLEKEKKELWIRTSTINDLENRVKELELWVDNIKDSENRIIVLEDKAGIKREEY